MIKNINYSRTVVRIKKQNYDKKKGIWIDKRTAIIVTLSDKSEKLHTIQSSIEEFHPKGGSGTKFKGGPQDMVQDSKYLEREKQQFKKFFAAIAEYIKDSDAIVIYGPAQIGQKLYDELSKSYP